METSAALHRAYSLVGGNKKNERMVGLSMMQRPLAIFFLILSLGCSRMYVDDRPFEETSWTIERAKTFRHDIPMQEKAPLYEDVTGRFYDKGAWTTELRLDDAGDPYGFSVAFVPRGYADVSCYLGRFLAAMCYKYAWEVWKYGQATPETELRLGQVFDAIETLCNISEIPGLPARGYRNKDTPYDEQEDQKWYAGRGQYEQFRYRAGASPPQYTGIVTGLQICYALGPDEYKPRIRAIMEDICLYLMAHDYQIVDIDGKPTEVSEFDPRDVILLLGSPRSGYMGLYLVYTMLPGGKTLSGIMTGNRAARNLLLLQFFRFGAISTGNPLILHEYLRLCQEGYAKRTVLAGVNFFGIMSAGDEIAKFDSWMCLLWPAWRDALPDAEYQEYYWQGMERVWPWVKDMKSIATAQYSFLHDRDEGIQEFLEMLDTFPYPNRRLDIVNSNRPDVELGFWAEVGKSLGPLCTADSILPFYEREANAWVWCRDPRRLDSEGDGTREFSYMDFLYAYWMMRYFEYPEAGQ